LHLDRPPGLHFVLDVDAGCPNAFELGIDTLGHAPLLAGFWEDRKTDSMTTNGKGSRHSGRERSAGRDSRDLSGSRRDSVRPTPLWRHAQAGGPRQLESP